MANLNEMPIRDILLVRAYPWAISGEKRFTRLCRSIICRKGANVSLNGHQITFFFPGIGRHIRHIHPEITEKLNLGQITDIVDIGGAGALIPELGIGDVILSSKDVLMDDSYSVPCRSRASLRQMVQALAQARGVKFFEGPILTTPHMVVTRTQRLRCHHKSNCLAVQMEHVWFLHSIQCQMDPAAFERLHVTHVEVITDEVPKSNSIAPSIVSCINAFLNVVIFNQPFIGGMKTDVLRTMLW